MARGNAGGCKSTNKSDKANRPAGRRTGGKKMIIKSMIKEPNYRSIIAVTPEHLYNAWKRGNTLHFCILSNEEKKPLMDVVDYFTVYIENGEIQIVADNVTLTLYSHDELINTIRCAFPDDWHDITTIIETLLYI